MLRKPALSNILHFLKAELGVYPHRPIRSWVLERFRDWGPCGKRVRSHRSFWGRSSRSHGRLRDVRIGTNCRAATSKIRVSCRPTVPGGAVVLYECIQFTIIQGVVVCSPLHAKKLQKHTVNKMRCGVLKTAMTRGGRKTRGILFLGFHSSRTTAEKNSKK